MQTSTHTSITCWHTHTHTHTAAALSERWREYVLLWFCLHLWGREAIEGRNLVFFFSSFLYRGLWEIKGSVSHFVQQRQTDIFCYWRITGKHIMRDRWFKRPRKKGMDNSRKWFKSNQEKIGFNVEEMRSADLEKDKYDASTVAFVSVLSERTHLTWPTSPLPPPRIDRRLISSA